MAYPQYQQPYPYQYQPQVPAPMDRLAQLQAQQQMFPTFVPETYQQQQQPQQPPINWVSGEAGARGWIVAADNQVLLMDSENPVFYIKSADKSGMPLPLRIFDYKERVQNAPQSSQSAQTDLDSKYVTRAEYDALNGKYMEILDRLNNFPAAPLYSDNGGKPTAAANKSRNRGGNDNE